MKAAFCGFLFLFSIFASANCEDAPEVKEEDNVLILTEKNFDHVVTTNQHLLVEFYAPWCGHCKALAPEYATAAKTLLDEGSEIKLAKVDATIEKQLGSKYGVKGYPTLKFFRNNKPVDYSDAPWCGPCAALEKEIIEVSKTFKKEMPRVKIGKLDGSAEEGVIQKLQIRGYPTILFMQFNGKRITTYNGGRKAADIVAWVKKKTGPPCKVLHSDDDVDSFKSQNEVAVIGHFASAGDSNAKNYEDVASGLDDLPFGIVYDSAIAGRVEIPINGVTVFKQDENGKHVTVSSTLKDKELMHWIIRQTSPLVVEMSERFDEGRADFDGDLSDSKVLTSFIKQNRLPLVNEFTQETASRVFGGDITTHNIMFISKLSPDFEKYYEAFKQAAAEFKGKVLFIFINADEQDNKRVMEFFSITDKDLPVLRIVKMAENMAKFKPETTDITKESVAQFTNDVLSGKAKRHLMSQDIPEDWDKNPVSVLVGKNFKEIAFDQSKKVFVEFYAPWCGHCKNLKPIYEKLGEHFKDNKDVVVAMVDATANEIEGIEVNGFPTLKFFPSGSDKVLDYNGDRTVEAMSEYIDSNGEKVSGGDPDEEEVDQVRPPTSPLPPKETAPPSADGRAGIRDPSKEANNQLDNIQEEMMNELNKAKESFEKKQEL